MVVDGCARQVLYVFAHVENKHCMNRDDGHETMAVCTMYKRITFFGRTSEDSTNDVSDTIMTARSLVTVTPGVPKADSLTSSICE